MLPNKACLRGGKGKQLKQSRAHPQGVHCVNYTSKDAVAESLSFLDFRGAGTGAPFNNTSHLHHVFLCPG